MIYQKFIEDALSQANLSGVPESVQNVKLFTWDHDLSRDKDWDDFIGGQLVAHTYWDEGVYQGHLDVMSMQFGTNANSIFGALVANESFVIYTSEYINMSNKFVSIGTDLENFYIATSYQLEKPETAEGQPDKSFYGKIVLVNIQKMLDTQFNDSTESPTININIGKLGETVTIPQISQADGTSNIISDPNFKTISKKKITIAMPKTVEVLLPSPAMFIGGGFDFIANVENGSPAGDRYIETTKATTKTLVLPENPYYCIAPVQWNVPSIDNYGFTHPADRSNAVKTLLATQQMGQVAQAGIGAGAATGIIPAAASAIGSGIIGLGQMFFGDKGTLANSTAITPQFLDGEGSPLKIFIQGDGRSSAGILDTDGYLNLQKLEDQDDFMEVNQANGQFGKFSKPMSPSQNNQFDSTTNWRGLGLKTLNLRGNPHKIPALATPFTGAGYGDLRINQTKINDLMKTGIPRQRINSGDIVAPMHFPNTWDVYIRNMFFRPDPYSFWNFPCLMPAEIGVYDVMKPTSISYDITITGAALEMLGKESQALKNTKDSYWNKTLRVSEITDNDLYDPNKTFSSFRFDIDTDTDKKKLYQLHMAAITSSTVKVLLLDEDGETIREHIFNSQGKNVGTSASWGSVFQF